MKHNSLWLLLGMAAAGATWGQGTSTVYPPINNATTIDSYPGPATNYLSVSNAYLKIDTRYPGIVATNGVPTTTNGVTTVPNLGYSNYRGGRCYLETTGGDPFTSADDNIRIMGPTEYSTWSVIQMVPPTTVTTTTGGGGDAGIPTSGTTPGAGGNTGIPGRAGLLSPIRRGATVLPGLRQAGLASTFDNYELETNYMPINDPSQDFITSYPAVSNGNSISVAYDVRNGLPSIANPIGMPEIDANGGIPAGVSTAARLLNVRLTYTLVLDKLRIETFVQNVSQQTLTVGCQTYVNPTFGGKVTNGNTFYFQGVSEPISHEQLFPSNNPQDDPGLREIPGTYRTIDNLTSPSVILGGLFSGADISTAPLAAGPPNQAMLLDQNLAQGDFLDYVPTGSTLIGANFSVLERWYPVAIAPNSGLRFITYFGLGGADGDYTSPYVLTAEAPFSLALTSTGNNANNLAATPNPFTVRASVYNPGSTPLSNVAVALSLPAGLTLAAGAALSQSLATVPAFTSQTVTWQVTAQNTAAPGNQTFTVSSSATGLPSKTVTRTIGIPALPTLQFPDQARQLDMISIPYDFSDRDLQHVLGSLGTVSVTGGGNAAVARYNPSTQAYAYFPDPYITSIYPGQGLWLFNGALTPLALPTDLSQLALTSQTSQSLAVGWNQVGCPFTVPVRLFDCTVETSAGTSYTFQDAVNASILQPVLYEYQPNDANPSVAGTYTYSGDDSTYLNPWRGYWIRCLQPITLFFNANSQVGPFASPTSRARVHKDYLALRGGWQASVTANADSFTPQVVQIGQDPTASDSYNTKDVATPPLLRSQQQLSLGINQPDWGRNAGLYLRDIRSATTSDVTWNVVSGCTSANTNVTLHWNLRGVPADVQLTLVDALTGSRRHLRTTSAYTYNTGAMPQPRTFQIIATHGSGSLVGVPYLQAAGTRGGGVSINYTLTGAANVDIVVESLTGRRVRLVESSRAAGMGQNQAVWDGRDDTGRPVPAGTYRCRVLVSTPDGQLATAERIVILNR
jgi:hypothetical protein